MPKRTKSFVGAGAAAQKAVDELAPRAADEEAYCTKHLYYRETLRPENCARCGRSDPSPSYTVKPPPRPPSTTPIETLNRCGVGKHVITRRTVPTCDLDTGGVIDIFRDDEPGANVERFRLVLNRVYQMHLSRDELALVVAAATELLNGGL